MRVRRRRKRDDVPGAAIAALTDFMDAALHSMERRIATTPAHQLVVRAIFDETAMLERQDAVGEPDRRQTVGHDENRTPSGHLRHVSLNDPLAFIVEGASRFIKDQRFWLAQRARGQSRSVGAAHRTTCRRARRQWCRNLRAAPE